MNHFRIHSSCSVFLAILISFFLLGLFVAFADWKGVEACCSCSCGQCDATVDVIRGVEMAFVCIYVSTSKQISSGFVF